MQVKIPRGIIKKGLSKKNIALTTLLELKRITKDHAVIFKMDLNFNVSAYKCSIKNATFYNDKYEIIDMNWWTPQHGLTHALNK